MSDPIRYFFWLFLLLIRISFLALYIILVLALPSIIFSGMPVSILTGVGTLLIYIFFIALTVTLFIYKSESFIGGNFKEKGDLSVKK